MMAIWGAFRRRCSFMPTYDSWLFGFDFPHRAGEFGRQWNEFGDESGTKIDRRDNEKHNFRIENNEGDQHRRTKKHDTGPWLLHVELFETGVTNRTDHQKGDQKNQQGPQERRSHEQNGRLEEMDDSGNHAGAHGNRQADEVAPGARLRWLLRLNVESGQAKRSAHEKRERGEPAKLVHVLDDVRLETGGGAQTPLESQHRGCDSKRDQIGQGVQLDAEVAVRLCQASDVAIHHVQHHAHTNGDRRVVVVRAQGRDHGIVAAKNIPNGEQAGNNGKAALNPCPVSNAYASALAFFCHEVSLITPIGVDPPRTRIPVSTVASVPAGNKTSTREPKRIKPMSSPFSTGSPFFFQHTIRRATSPAT